MRNIFAELQRRHIYQVAAAYVVVAWVLLQLFNNLEPIMKLPDWTGTLILVFLVGGFPIALIFAWTLELKSAPARGDAKPKPPQTLAPPIVPAKTGVISIAVLPFANMSGDASQEFFSDGMTEEITAALAQIKGLRVVGRTSAFQFKGQNKELRAIGQSLGASHLIEGSVRKSGNRVRITAQLVHAGEDTHLWAQSYDRELTDIFVVQEEIATAIARSLQMPLGLKQGEALIFNRTGDLDAYQEYLRARALLRSRDIDKAIKLLESVVAREPNFAPAWGLLANAYTFIPLYSPSMRSDLQERARKDVQADLAKAEKAAREAIRLDAHSAVGYSGLAFTLYARAKWVEAEDLYRKAFELDPNDADSMHVYSVMLTDAGHIRRALVFREKLRALEPFVPIYNALTAGMLQTKGDNDGAIAILEAISPSATGGYYRNFLLARAYAARAEFDKAADTILLIKGGVVSRASVEDAAHLIRVPVQAAEPDRLPTLQGELGFVYAYIGAVDRMLDFPQRLLAIGHAVQLRDSLWLPIAAPLRKTERFKKLVHDLGLVDYWKARGWPDLCRPMGADGIVCD